MKRMISLSILAAAAVAGSAHAHDFWVQPETFTPAEGESLPVSLFVGHGSDKSDWPVRPHRIIGFQTLGPNGPQSQVRGAESLTGALSVMLDAPGMHLISVETTNSFSELEAGKFNDYAEEEGIHPIDWDEGDAMPIKVHYHGAPVSGATLHITDLDDETVHFSAQTDAEGQVDISASLTEGRWLVHTVWAEAAAGLLEGADYQTVFSSLTFDTQSPCPG